MAPPQPRRTLLALLFAKETTETQTPPQLPPPMFPTTYYQAAAKPDAVLPASLDTAAESPGAMQQTVRKPGVLTAWFQKAMGCGHSSGCHHGGSAPCCPGCTCDAGTNPSIANSPRANMAAWRSKQASAHVHTGVEPAPAPSSGADPGDVAEEGKLFERVSFEGLDKSPQG